MEWVETTGRTVEEALEVALDELGVDEADAEYEVLEEPKTGLFGRLRTEARVRARVRPTTPRPKEDRRSRGRKAAAGRAGSATKKASPAPEAATATTAEPVPGTEDTIDEERDMTDQRTDEAEVPIAEQGERGADFVRGVLERFGAPAAQVSTVLLSEDTVEVRVEGEDLGLLIGPKGATLQALQELTRTVVQRQTGARSGRLLLDVSGYRQRRKEALERFAQKIAEDVRSSGTRIVLEPMSPADRKIIHDTMNDIDGVTTSSEGEEPRRRVVVSPA